MLGNEAEDMLVQWDDASCWHNGTMLTLSQCRGNSFLWRVESLSGIFFTTSSDGLTRLAQES